LNYVKTLAEENIFTKERAGQLLAKSFKTHTAALDTAIGLEKDSIIFYNEMKSFVPESEHRPINEIINQEKEHLRKLSEIKRMGVTVSRHSPKWKGYEKKELLEKLLRKLYWRVPGSVS